MLAHYIRSQLILSGLAMAVYVIGLNILRVPYATVLGVGSGIAEFIPTACLLISAVLIVVVALGAGVHSPGRFDRFPGRVAYDPGLRHRSTDHGRAPGTASFTHLVRHPDRSRGGRSDRRLPLHTGHGDHPHLLATLARLQQTETGGRDGSRAPARSRGGERGELVRRTGLVPPGVHAGCRGDRPGRRYRNARAWTPSRQPVWRPAVRNLKLGDSTLTRDRHTGSALRPSLIVQIEQAAGGAEGSGVSRQHLAFDLRQVFPHGRMAAKSPMQLVLHDVVHPGLHLLLADALPPAIFPEQCRVLADKLPQAGQCLPG